MTQSQLLYYHQPRKIRPGWSLKYFLPSIYIYFFILRSETLRKVQALKHKSRWLAIPPLIIDTKQWGETFIYMLDFHGATFWEIKTHFLVLKNFSILLVMTHFITSSILIVQWIRSVSVYIGQRHVFFFCFQWLFILQKNITLFVFDPYGLWSRIKYVVIKKKKRERNATYPK